MVAELMAVFSCLSGSVVSFGNIVYVILFGWWISLIYILVCPLMYLTYICAPYGRCSAFVYFIHSCLFFFEHHWIFFYYFAHFRQTLFKIGLVLYLAVWEVSREGKYSNLSVEVVVVGFFFF